MTPSVSFGADEMPDDCWLRVARTDAWGWFREVLPHVAADRLEPTNPWFPRSRLSRR
jgi:hypothetical protein